MQMMAHPIQMSFAISFCWIFVIYKDVTALQNHFNILLILLSSILKFLIDYASILLKSRLLKNKFLNLLVQGYAGTLLLSIFLHKTNKNINELPRNDVLFCGENMLWIHFQVNIDSDHMKVIQKLAAKTKSNIISQTNT